MLARMVQEGGASARKVAAMYEEAARAGCGAAMNNLALLYLSGRHPAGMTCMHMLYVCGYIDVHV